MVSPKPASVRLRAYKIGFGDCLLITIGYSRPLADGRSERHLLVDFGSKAGAKDGPKMPQVAEKIAEHCGGRLDVVVVTHRHQDHVRGFGDKKARERLDPLQPSVIIRPWTDMPAPSRGQPDANLGAASHRFFELLDTLGDHNRTVEQAFDLDRRVLAKRAKELAALGVSNVEALAMLDAWVPADRTRWVKAGDVVDVDELPGVGIEVLGPPTLEQVPRMKSYASSSSEYWLGMAEDDAIEPELVAPPEAELIPAKETVAAPGGLGRASWLLDRLHDQAPRQVLEIVEGFEDVLNNTSVVLLLTVGRRRLLLTGDAQVENWSYTLDRAVGTEDVEKDGALRSRLVDVDLYKVGHHGSRNATPRRLVDLWSSERRRGHALCSVLSTQGGLYGTTVEGVVPKPELVAALEGLGALHSTERLAPDVWWFDVKASATSRSAEFRYEAGPPQV